MSPLGSCGAVLPNPATHGDTHLHVCELAARHDVRHVCVCGVQWAHELRSDGASATLIRFPTDRAPQVNLRRGDGGFGNCMICDEPPHGPFERFEDGWYHRDCAHDFAMARQTAAKLLETLAGLPPGRRVAHLVRLLSKFARL